MLHGYINFTKRCDACQFHANFIHQTLDCPTIASCPSKAWGLDVMGPLTLKSSIGHMYILAATDYFSKWAKVVVLKSVKKKAYWFIWRHIIYRYDVPQYIITDNGKAFVNKLMTSIFDKFKFTQHKSSMYNALANGLAKNFNKLLYNLSKKVPSQSQQEWYKKLGEVLWAY